MRPLSKGSIAAIRSWNGTEFRRIVDAVLPQEQRKLTWPSMLSKSVAITACNSLMARARSFFSSAISAIWTCGLSLPVAIGRTVAARSNACIASSAWPALRS